MCYQVVSGVADTISWPILTDKRQSRTLPINFSKLSNMPLQTKRRFPRQILCFLFVWDFYDLHDLTIAFHRLLDVRWWSWSNNASTMEVIRWWISNLQRQYSIWRYKLKTKKTYNVDVYTLLHRLSATNVLLLKSFYNLNVSNITALKCFKLRNRCCLGDIHSTNTFVGYGWHRQRSRMALLYLVTQLLFQ